MNQYRDWPGRLLAGLLATGVLLLAGGPARAQEGGRVVVLGFDGADYRLVRDWMAEGHLPHLQALAEAGSFTPLLPTNPPQTPVAWSSFATGLNPGRTGIFDFLRRTDGTYFPEFALMDDTQRTDVLFGVKTPLYLGGMAGGGGLLLGLLGVLAFGRSRKILGLSLSLVLGLALAAGTFWAADAYIPTSRPIPVNNRQGTPIWEALTEAGKRSRIVRLPATFPVPETMAGEMLSGLGVPDMRLTIGRPTIFTSNPDFFIGDNEFNLEVVRIASSGVIPTQLTGPPNKLFFNPLDEEDRQALRKAGVAEELSVPVHLERDGDRVAIEVAGQTRKIGLKEWSDWTEVTYAFNRFITAKGMVRFYVLSLDPHLEIYCSPIHFHPTTSGTQVPFTYPPDYSRRLVEKYGLFKTMGWGIDTWTISSDLADEEHFLTDMAATVDQFETMTLGMLEEGGFDLFINVFMFTDRVGHILWRLIDEGNPTYDPDTAARYAGEVLKAYQRMDAIVGKVRERLAPDDTLIICSDHGFSSFRWQFNTNTWLVQNGYMKFRGQYPGIKTLEHLFGRGDFFEGVDWSQTRAYAMGLGSVYINLRGREPFGIVNPGADYEALGREIAEKMEAYVDERTGLHPVRKVYHRKEIYTEFDPTLIPDLRVANNLNYRVSWQTTLGGVPPEIVEDNLKNWSGDHCSLEPTEVPGILFTNRPVRREDGTITDLFPTILQALQVTPPAGIDGRSLF